ncbi:RraA family protein [Kitasatospora sp. NPDC057965]|uniref:RraA family protein n=1 Tax=Kitasatospora sp. NPDC057965 TaxID=3346291 RepID=UPI0036DAEF2F
MVKRFAELSTPLVADACVRVGVAVRAAPAGVRAVVPGGRVAGRVLPVRHYGSVDVFLEAYGAAEPGDVVVIDNGGRLDEACVGDLAVLVFSYGSLPAGPLRLDGREPEALASARFGPHLVGVEDVVFADSDGVLFVPGARLDEVLEAAAGIARTERAQADRIRSGDTLRRQTAFDEYLERREADPEYSFRRHLRRIGGAIEE